MHQGNWVNFHLTSRNETINDKTKKDRFFN